MAEYELSVVIPVYNSGKYLRECVESVMSGTDLKIQLVIVNDGSTDDSQGYIDEIAKSNHDVSVIVQDNQGLGPARNSGIEAASGKYVAFLDSDDVVENRHYDNLYKMAESTNCDICYAGFTLSSNDVLTRIENPYKGNVFAGEQVTHYHLLLCGSNTTDLNEDTIPVSSCFGLYRTSFLKQTGVKFEPILSEDVVFNIEVTGLARTVACSSETGYIYRQDNGDSITRAYDGNKIQKLNDYFIALRSLLAKIDPAIREQANDRINRRIISNSRGYLIQLMSRKDVDWRTRRSDAGKLLELPVLVEALADYPLESLPIAYRVAAYAMKARLVYPLALGGFAKKVRGVKR